MGVRPSAILSFSCKQIKAPVVIPPWPGCSAERWMTTTAPPWGSLPEPADKPLFFRAAQFNMSEHFFSPEKHCLELFLLAPSRGGCRNDHSDGNTGLAFAATHSRHPGEDRDGDRHGQPGTAWAKGYPVRNGILVTTIQHPSQHHSPARAGRTGEARGVMSAPGWYLSLSGGSIKRILWGTAMGGFV